MTGLHAKLAIVFVKVRCTYGHMNEVKKIRVLLLEDDSWMSEFLCLIVENSEWADRFEFQILVDGDLAWAELNREAPDIFITDIIHPGLDGRALLKQLAAKKVTYPVLVISAMPWGSDEFSFAYFCDQECVGGAPLEGDLNAVLSFYDLLALGVSYRSYASLDFLTQVRVSKQLSVGYSYEYSTNELSNFTSG